jgi:hypothetical protein
MHPPPPKLVSALADENGTTMRVPKIWESLRRLRTPTGWTSPPTHCRKKMSDSLILGDCF